MDAGTLVSTEEVTRFVSDFYDSINAGTSLEDYYISPAARYPDLNPDISIGGTRYESPAEYEALLERQSNPTVGGGDSDANGATKPINLNDDNDPLKRAITNGNPSRTIANPFLDKGAKASPRALLRAKYRYELIDSQVANTDFNLGDPGGIKGSASSASSANSASTTTGPAVGERFGITVQITGRTIFTDDPADDKTFNEVLVLVPNWAALDKNAPKNARKKVIMSQIFRYVTKVDRDEKLKGRAKDH